MNIKNSSEYQKISQFINENKLDEVEKIFDKLVNENPRDMRILFDRCSFLLFYKGEKSESLLNDLLRIFNSRNLLKNKVAAYLSIYYYKCQDAYNVVNYGNYKNIDCSGIEIPFYIAYGFSVANLGNETSVKRAITYLKKVIDDPIYDDTLLIQYALIKCYTALNEFDKANREFEKIYTIFGPSQDFYYYYLDFHISKYILENDIKEKDIIIDIINKLDNYIDFVDNNDSFIDILSIKLRAYCKIEEFDSAFGCLEQYKKAISDEYYVLYKMDIDFEMNNFKQFKNDAVKFLNNNQSEYVKNYYRRIILYHFETKEDLEKIIEFYSDFNIDINDDEQYILECLQFAYHNLDRIKEFDELCKKYIQKDPQNEFLKYIIAENAVYLNYDYEQIMNEYKKCSKNLFGMVYYIRTLISYAKNPSKYYRILNKLLLTNVNENYKNLIYMHLYGKWGAKQDFKLIKKIVNEIINSVSNIDELDPCTIGIIGRCIEFISNDEEALRYYQKAYEKKKNLDGVSLIQKCGCVDGYLARVYRNGIFTKKNDDKAKEIILKSIDEFNKRSNNVIVYLYAIYSLEDNVGFDLIYAKSLLEEKSIFERYDITKLLLLKQIEERLTGLPCDKYNEEIKNSLKYGTKYTKNFYNKYINKQVNDICEESI